MASQLDVLIRNAQAVIGDQLLFCDIGIETGTISRIVPWGTGGLNAKRIIEADGRWVLPGAIDTHCHMGQVAPEYAGRPGLDARTNFAWESRAAVSGGVTTALNYLKFSQDAMLAMYGRQVKAAQEESIIDILFHGYVMNELHLSELSAAVAMGIRSFKMFLPYRGDEARALGGISSLNYGELQVALRRMSALGGHAMIHAEDGDIVDAWSKGRTKESPGSLMEWEASRPTSAEGTAAYAALYLAQKEACKVTIVHVSSGEAVAARRALPGLGATLESCPHYLVLAVEDGLGAEGKVAPPIRHRSDVEALWAAVEAGEIDFFGSDHNVWPQDAKCAVWTAKAGLPGVDLMVPLLLTTGWVERGIPLPRMVDLLATNAARHFGLYPKKGAIQVGSDADLVVVEIGTKVVRVQDSQSAVDYSPYEGRVLKAWPVTTVRGGEIVYLDGKIMDGATRGRILNEVLNPLGGGSKHGFRPRTTSPLAAAGAEPGGV